MIPAESIERVIDDLETRIEMLMATNELLGVAGAIHAYKTAIRELRKVLEDYGAREP